MKTSFTISLLSLVSVLSSISCLVSANSREDILECLAQDEPQNSWLIPADPHEDFLQCLSRQAQNSASISKVIYPPHNSSYLSTLRAFEQNLRFTVPGTLLPQVIVTPLHASDIQATIYCSRRHGLQIRVRSGGHDYEGLSYISDVPFVLLDMFNLRSVTVNLEDNTAWVEAGATLGELYYKIAEKSRTLAFPAGVFPSVGVGGHISGGGYSFMSREYGLAIDHVIDAQLIGVDGRILDRESMGEDLFWAIRGGGSASFGVILAWKISLVAVPETVTVFTVPRTLEQNATKLVHRWQHIADKLDNKLMIRVLITTAPNKDGEKTVLALFICLFLGRSEQLIPLMQQKFPELGFVKEDCIEMSWIQSALYFPGFSINDPLEVLLNRSQQEVTFFKGKSDFVKEPISEDGLEGIWEHLYDIEAGIFHVLLSPYGGRLGEISESATPFPHRAGILYNIHYVVMWREEEQTERYITWMRRLHSFTAQFVPNSPRAAYINYRDLDIGVNNKGYTSYEQASIWGLKYFKNNFDRLVQIKTMVDPTNFFRNEQSIPPLSSQLQSTPC